MQFKLNSVRGIISNYGFVWGKLKQTDWLLGLDGNLQAIYVMTYYLVLSLQAYVQMTKGVRWQGAAGWAGVLPCFIRGPNGQK